MVLRVSRLLVTTILSLLACTTRATYYKIKEKEEEELYKQANTYSGRLCTVTGRPEIDPRMLLAFLWIGGWVGSTIALCRVIMVAGRGYCSFHMAICIFQ